MVRRLCDKTTLTRLFAFILLLPTTVLTAPSAPSATWLYPDPSATPTFNYVDTLNISWQSNYPNAYVVLWCGIPDLSNINLCRYPRTAMPHFPTKYPCSGSNNSVPSIGSQQLGLNCGGAGICHCEISSPNLSPAADGTSFSSNSGGWNVKEDSSLNPVAWSQNSAEAPANTSTTTQATTTPTSSTSSTSSTSATATGSTDNPTTSSSLSTAGKAGIGVGVSVGVLLALAGAFLVFRMRKRRQVNLQDDAREMNSDTGLMKKETDNVGLKGVHEQGPGEAHEMEAMVENLSEMHGSEVHAELDGASAAVDSK
jgi:hypothetical protein